jgi:hypothetical protein
LYMVQLVIAYHTGFVNLEPHANSMYKSKILKTIMLLFMGPRDLTLPHPSFNEAIASSHHVTDCDNNEQTCAHGFNPPRN